MNNFYSLLEINLDTRHILDIFIFNYKKLNNAEEKYYNKFFIRYRMYDSSYRFVIYLRRVKQCH